MTRIRFPAGSAAPGDRPGGGSILARLASDRRGNTALTFALSLLPVLYSAGAVVDYTRMMRVQSGIQEELDKGALSVAAAQDTTSFQSYVAQIKSNVLTRYQADGLQNVTLTGEWISGVDFQITASADLKMMFLPALSSLSKTNKIAATTIARTSTPIYTYNNPDLSQLDPEAGDYNRMGVYCFNKSLSNTESKGRGAVTWIADNGGTKYTFTMPTCGKGETLSYVLKNVRNSRTTKKNWDNPKAETYFYYTDTTINLGVESYDLGGWVILETVLCDSKDMCLTTKSKGGSIPFGKERTPEKASGMCKPGKYMYYGWEDRPPGAGWTDKDYDDIRVVIECPTVTASGTKEVFLLR